MQEYAGSETAKIHLSNKEIRQALKDYPYHNIKQVGKTGAGSQLACYSKFPILSARMLDYRSNYNGSQASLAKAERNLSYATTQMDRLYFESSLAQALPDTPAPIITTSYMLFSFYKYPQTRLYPG